MNNEAFIFLKNYYNNVSNVPITIREQGWESKSSEESFGKIPFPFKGVSLSSKRHTRNELLDKIDKTKNQNNITSNEIKTLIIEILSWGGIRFNNRKKEILNHIEPIEKICSGLIYNQISELEAYKQFYEAGNSRSIKELGPAYYTKLIFFLGKQTGLIMDQWTARSVNLLSGKQIVSLSRKQKNRCYVRIENDFHNYSDFIEFCNIIKKELQLPSLNMTEELIFSCSPDKASVKNKLGQYHELCSSWRKYVIENT